jgi:tetratricopeptide (TPR) repeat protein
LESITIVGMTEQQWDRFSEIAAEALEKSGEARGEFVRAACGGDAELQGRVEQFLKRAGEAAGFLEGPIEGMGGLLGERAGMRVGAFVLYERLGEGGMGEVWSARRADGQFEQTVAIKLLSTGRISRWHAERFREERQILASLDHPNIARLLDGGITADGLPYLAMERIEGERSDVFCRKLTVGERLEVFEKICEAVQYAHRQLVVHRDIKSSNILVTADGVPKLLDFGIARTLEQSDGQSAKTVTRVFTPDYASPEQIEGKPCGMGTDVYSLGVVLFEWLTGRRPYRLAGKTMSEVLETVCRTGVPVAGTGSAELDAIIGKATRIEPGERYASVAELAADVRRYREGRPVMAQPASWLNAFRKLILRNRLASGIAVAAGVLLIVAAAAVLVQWNEARHQRAQAEQRFNSLRKLARTLMFDLHDRVALLPNSLEVRRFLVKEATAYLDPLSRSVAGNAELQADLIQGYVRMGQVQASQMGESQGEVKAALVNYDKAIAAAEQAMRESPNPPKTLLAAAADAYTQRGGIRSERQETKGAIADLDRAIEIGRRGNLRLPLRQALFTKAYMLLDHEPAAALPIYDELQKGFERDRREDPKHASPRSNLMLLHINAGMALGKLGKGEESRRRFQQAIEIGELHRREDPKDIRTKGSLRLAYAYLAQNQMQDGLLEEAAESMRKNLEILPEYLAARQGNPVRFGSVGLAYFDLGVLESKRGRRKQAIEAFRVSVENYSKTMKALPDLPAYRIRTIMALNGLGEAVGGCGACEFYRAAGELLPGVKSREGIAKQEVEGLDGAAAGLERCRKTCGR